MITSKKTLIALIALVLVLCAGIFFALKYTKPDTDTEDNGSDSIVTAFEKDISLLDSVTVTNKGGEYTLAKTGDETYEANGNSEIILKNSRVKFLFEQISNITAESLAEENAEDLSKYSLDKPSSAATAHFSDGDVTFKVGGQTSKGSYFFAVDNSVYIVSTSFASLFSNELSYYRETSILNVSADDLTCISFAGENDTVTLKKEGDDWKMTAPLNTDAYIGSVSEHVLTKIGSLSVSEFIEDNASDLSKYGFSKYVYFEDSKGAKQKIFVGNKSGDGYFIMCEDSKSVYTAPMDSLSFISLKAINFTDGFVCLTNIKDITGVDVYDAKTGGKYTFSIIRNGDNETYSANSAEVTKEKFTDVYQKIIGITAKDFAYGLNGKDKVCEIVYHMNDKTDITVEFFDYESRKCIANVTGGKSFIALSGDVEDMLAAVKK